MTASSIGWEFFSRARSDDRLHPPLEPAVLAAAMGPSDGYRADRDVGLPTRQSIGGPPHRSGFGQTGDHGLPSAEFPTDLTRTGDVSEAGSACTCRA